MDRDYTADEMSYPYRYAYLKSAVERVLEGRDAFAMEALVWAYHYVSAIDRSAEKLRREVPA